MQITTEKLQQVYDWLLLRGISESIIKTSKLDWNGHEIVIPIFDRNGIFLFNKYRRDPFMYSDTNVPKYRYEKGSEATLYNIHTVFGLTNQTIFIVEGELDALRLNSLGILAVSSTGGCGTFKKEWAEDLKNNIIYIVYDRDEAGIKGALKVNEIIPKAKIIFLPYMSDGKDITDYLKNNTIKNLQNIANDSDSWIITSEPKETPHLKIAIHRVIKAYREEADILLEKQRLFNQQGKSIKHIEIMTDRINERINYWTRHYANISKVLTSENKNNIPRAKTAPITNFLEFNRQDFALCLWHTDTRPSLHYIKSSNRVFCFSCNANKDVIDVVMAKRNVEFAEALKIILNR